LNPKGVNATKVDIVTPSVVHGLASGQKPSHTGQAKPSQMSWPEAGFGLALEFRSQSQASKPWLWMNIYLIIYNKLL
jgi:hypothetical protein